MGRKKIDDGDKRIKLSFSMDKGLGDKLNKHIKDNHINRSRLIESLIKKYVNDLIDE